MGDLFLGVGSLEVDISHIMRLHKHNMLFVGHHLYKCVWETLWKSCSPLATRE